MVYGPQRPYQGPVPRDSPESYFRRTGQTIGGSSPADGGGSFVGSSGGGGGNRITDPRTGVSVQASGSSVIDQRNLNEAIQRYDQQKALEQAQKQTGTKSTIISSGPINPKQSGPTIQPKSIGLPQGRIKTFFGNLWNTPTTRNIRRTGSGFANIPNIPTTVYVEQEKKAGEQYARTGVTTITAPPGTITGKGTAIIENRPLTESELNKLKFGGGDKQLVKVYEEKAAVISTDLNIRYSNRAAEIEQNINKAISEGRLTFEEADQVYQREIDYLNEEYKKAQERKFTDLNQQFIETVEKGRSQRQLRENVIVGGLSLASGFGMGAAYRGLGLGTRLIRTQRLAGGGLLGYQAGSITKDYITGKPQKANLKLASAGGFLIGGGLAFKTFPQKTTITQPTKTNFIGLITGQKGRTIAETKTLGGKTREVRLSDFEIFPKGTRGKSLGFKPDRTVSASKDMTVSEQLGTVKLVKETSKVQTKQPKEVRASLIRGFSQDIGSGELTGLGIASRKTAKPDIKKTTSLSLVTKQGEGFYDVIASTRPKLRVYRTGRLSYVSDVKDFNIAGRVKVSTPKGEEGSTKPINLISKTVSGIQAPRTETVIKTTTAGPRFSVLSETNQPTITNLRPQTSQSLKKDKGLFAIRTGEVSRSKNDNIANLKPLQSSKGKLSIAEAGKTATISGFLGQYKPLQAQKLKSLRLSTPKLKPIQYNTSIYNRILRPIRTTPPRPPTGFRDYGIRSDRLVPGYLTFVKRKGKFYRLGSVTSYSSAVSRGARAVDVTTSRTFKVVPTAQKVRATSGGYFPSYKFRTFRQTRGRRTALSNTFIERSRFAISSRGEKQGLKLARMLRR